MSNKKTAGPAKPSPAKDENFDDIEDAFFASGDAVSFWDDADVDELTGEQGDKSEAEAAPVLTDAPVPVETTVAGGPPSPREGTDPDQKAPTPESEADIYNPSTLHPNPDLIADDETEIWTDPREIGGNRESVSQLDPGEEIAPPKAVPAPSPPAEETPISADEFGVLRYSIPEGEESRWAEASKALVAAAREVEPSERADLLLNAAQIQLARVGNWERAATLFDEAVASGTPAAALPKGYADVVASQGRFEELRDILVDRANGSGGAAAIEALQDAAIVERNHLNNDAAAVDLLNRANSIQSDWFSLRLLRELHYRRQDWKPLTLVLAEMARLSSGPRAARCKVEEGRIKEVELGDVTGAAASYSDALVHAPSYMDAFLARIRVAKNNGDGNALVDLYRAHADSLGGPNKQFWLEAAARTASAENAEVADNLYRAAMAGSEGSAASIFREAAAHFERRGDSSGVYEARVAEAKTQTGAARAATLLLVGESIAGEPDRAIAQLTEALNADSTCLPAVRLATDLMVQASRGEGAVGLLEKAIAQEANTSVGGILRFRLAEVLEHSMDKPDAAAEAYAAARTADPGLEVAREAEVRCLRQAGQHEAAVERLRDAVAETQDPERATRLLWTIGSILERDLGRQEEAIEAYRKAAQMSALQPAAIDGWVQNARRNGSTEDLVDALLHASEGLPSLSDRVAAGYAAARLMVDVLNNPERAAGTLGRCMELDPHNRLVNGLLRDVSVRTRNWPTVYDLARSASNGLDGRHREWTLLQAGYASMQGNCGDAQAVAAEVLDLNPSHPGALGLLERDALARGDDARILGVTRRVRNATEDSAERTTLTVRIAQLAADIGDKQTASRAITRVLEASVGPRPYGAMAKLSVGMELWALAEAALHADGDVAGLARLLESTSEDHKRVSSAWRAVTKDNPESTEGHHGLERSLTRMANRDGLAAAHAALASNESDSTVSNMHALLAGHLFENDEANEKAIKYYRMAFDRTKHRGKAFDALVRLYCELGRTDAINDIFRQLPDLDDVGRADALIDAGATEEALTIYRESVKAATDDRAALPMLVRYEQALVNAGKWGLVLECLNRRGAMVDDPQEKAFIQAKQRWLLSERMADSDEAWEFYRQLHEDHPDDSEVLENLARIAGARGESTLAIQFLDGLSNIASTAEEAARYQRRIAEVHTANDAPDHAREAFLRALDHNPNDLESLAGLKSIAEAASDWQGLVGALTRESQLVQGEKRQDCARQIALLWEEKIGDRAVAIESWRRVLELSPGDQTSLSRLVALAEAEADWNSFIDDGKALVHYLEGEDRSELLARMGRAAFQHLRREEEAIRFLDEASSNSTPSLQAAEDLEQIHAARGSWDKVVECILRRATAQSGDAAIELYQRAAKIRIEQLRDRSGAASVYDSILALDPTNITALEFKGDYLFENDNLSGAVEVYEAIDGLGIERDLDDFDEQMAQSLYCFRFGEALRRLGRLQDAVQRYEQALALNGSHLPTLEAIGPLYVAEQRFSDASSVFRQVLQLTGGQGDPVRLARVYAALGTVEHAQGNDEKAVRRFNKALDLQPNDIEALQGYACVLYERQDWNNLLTTYNNIIYHAKEREAFVKAYLMKGFVLDSHMSLADKAGQHYEKSLSFDAANPYALLRLGELALRKDEWDRAASFAGRALAIGENVTKELSALLHSVSAVAAKETGRMDELEAAFTGIKAAGTEYASEAIKLGPSAEGLHELLRSRLQREP